MRSSRRRSSTRPDSCISCPNVFTRHRIARMNAAIFNLSDAVPESFGAGRRRFGTTEAPLSANMRAVASPSSSTGFLSSLARVLGTMSCHSGYDKALACPA